MEAILPYLDGPSFQVSDMVILSVFIVFAVLTLVLVLWTYCASHKASRLDELEQLVQPVDLEALGNLLDPLQEQYLRLYLGFFQSCKYKAMRITAANQYIRRASRNAGILMNIGRVAARSPDADIAAAGMELAKAAYHLRLYSLLARFALVVQMVLPNPMKSFHSFVDDYNQVRQRVVRLGQLQGTVVLGYL
jgi:hypothetical protein